MAIWHRSTGTLTDRRGASAPHATAPRQRSWRLLERLLLIVGFVCLGYYGYVSAEAALYQAYETRELNAILASAPPRADVALSPDPLARPRVPPPVPGSTMGRIDIPRLGVSAVLRAGSDARTLRLAVGHIPGTALPGEVGNIGLAAHRDTFFRRLGKIRSGDSVHLVTPAGTFTYRVDGTQIVEPHDTWVLNSTETPELTLVTCYPFRYIGSAPQRFIVRARLSDG